MMCRTHKPTRENIILPKRPMRQPPTSFPSFGLSSPVRLMKRSCRRRHAPRGASLRILGSPEGSRMKSNR